MVGDEYDALLEEPFGEDVNWAVIDGMAGPAGSNSATAGGQAAGSASENDEYFNDDEAIDESFLNEVRRLENHAIGNISATNAPPPGMFLS